MTARRGGEGGFLLIGVVMFVLALTILGLSLYSLSTYEADFQGGSRDSDAAFYEAQGGLVMVQALLATPPYKLSTAADAVGHMGVASAVAAQRRTNGTVDSQGAVDWNDTVTVTLQAQDNGTTRTLRASYLPRPRVDYYKRLFTACGTSVSKSPSSGTQLVPGSVFVETDNSCCGDGHGNPDQRLRTVVLGDTCHVWQTSTDSSWVGDANWRKLRPLTLGTVPLADVQGYYATHPTVFTPKMTVGGGGGGGEGGEGGGGSDDITLEFKKHAAGTVGYYASPPAMPFNTNSNYSFWAPSVLDLEVQGTVVWEMPRGLRSENEVTIRNTGSGTATIIIVGSPVPVGSPQPRTGPNTDPLIGLWFFGGLTVVGNDVNVILVSEGQVNLERTNNPTGNESAPRLSIYAKAVYLMGPRIGDVTQLDHASDLDAYGGTIDLLEWADVLPKPAGVVPGLFSLLRGSWRDLTP